MKNYNIENADWIDNAIEDDKLVCSYKEIKVMEYKGDGCS